jgi:hypothetical protein
LDQMLVGLIIHGRCLLNGKMGTEGTHFKFCSAEIAMRYYHVRRRHWRVVPYPTNGRDNNAEADFFLLSHLAWVMRKYAGLGVRWQLRNFLYRSVHGMDEQIVPALIWSLG